MGNVLNLALHEVRALLERSDLCARDVLMLSLEHIRAHQPKIRAFTELNSEKALQVAASLDLHTAQGKSQGPLHGVPIAIKDMFYLPDRVPTGGSDFLQRMDSAQQTASVWTRLEAAGAILVGFTHMTEFAVGPTGHNEHYGPCHNPFDLAYIAGGSSSGSAASVAARMAYGSVGSDTGGSIRIPAAATGVYGIKPTLGRVPRTGSMPLSHSLDTVGPLARHPLDLAVLLQCMAGEDSIDLSASSRPVDDYVSACGKTIKGLRIGLPREFFNDLSDSVRTTVELAISHLQSMGANCVEVSVPHAKEHRDLSRALFYSEAAAIHGYWLRQHLSQYSDQVGNRLLTGMAIPAMTYVEALLLRPRLLKELVQAVFGQCDVLLTSAMPTDLPTLQDTDAGGGPMMWSIIDQLLKHAAGFNYLGLPALVAPVRLTPKGLPSAVQLIAKPFAETKLFTVASALEQLTGFSKLAPPLCGL